MAPVPTPEVAVVVPSHDRALRLRWLLAAIAAQDGAPAHEVLVVHDSTDGTSALLAGAGPAVRALRAPAGTGPALKRNIGWRAARAPLVAFCDDDCRPAPGWLAELARVAAAHPGRVVQGAVEPDPDEAHLLVHAPHAHTLRVVPPDPLGQTANILYPRALLERLGGFDESFTAVWGEDTELLARAGGDPVPAPRALVWHAVHDAGLVAHVRRRRRQRWMPLVVARAPALRRRLVLRVFLDPRHAALVLGALAARRTGPLALLPWLVLTAPRYGLSPRGVARTAAELPGRAIVDVVEVASCLEGSLRARTLVL